MTERCYSGSGQGLSTLHQMKRNAIVRRIRLSCVKNWMRFPDVSFIV